VQDVLEVLELLLFFEDFEGRGHKRIRNDTLLKRNMFFT
jgi:hypothetical protein